MIIKFNIPCFIFYFLLVDRGQHYWTILVPSPILRADYKFTNLIILQYEEKQIYRERNGAGGQAV